MSQKKGGLDLTVGEPMKLLVLFAIPMLIGSVFQLMYNMVDTIVLGRFVSPEALAAVGATSSTMSLIMLAANAATNAMSILISHAWGAKNEVEIRKIMGQMFSMVVLVSAAVGVLSVTLAGPVMRFLGTPEDIRDGAVLYISIAGGLYAAQMFYNASAAVLRAIGDSRTPLYFLILCSLMNIVLDLLFVHILPNGIAAVALATVFSQLTSAVLCCVYMWRKYRVLRFGRSDLRPDSKRLRRFAVIALPMIFQNVMLSVGMMAITSVINSFGSDIVAAFTVGGKVEQLVTVIFSQVAFSFSVYAGQNFGAKKYDRIDLGMQRALILLSGLVAISMTVLFLFCRPMALLFVDAEETGILSAALKMIRIEAAFMPLLCAIWLFNSALRGMGFIRPTVISAMLELFSKIGFSFGLSALMGYVGIWLATPLGWVIGVVPSIGYFYFGKWKVKALAADEKAAAGGENAV